MPVSLKDFLELQQYICDRDINAAKKIVENNPDLLDFKKNSTLHTKAPNLPLTTFFPLHLIYKYHLLSTQMRTNTTGSQYLDLFEYFLEHGADINAYYENKIQPLLFEAIESGDVREIHRLSIKGANLELRFNGQTPLLTAFYNACGDIPYNNGKNIFKALLQCGADPNAPISESQTATVLHVAAGRCQLDMIKLLVANGAYINAKSSDGETPLELLRTKMNQTSSYDHFYAQLQQCIDYLQEQASPLPGTHTQMILRSGTSITR